MSPQISSALARILPPDVPGALADMRSRVFEDGIERLWCLQLLQATSGEMRGLIPPMPSEDAEHQAQRSKFAPGILDPIFSALTYLYDSPPMRASSTEDAWREALYRPRLGLDTYMDRADYLARLGGVSAIRCVPAIDPTGLLYLRLGVLSRAQLFVVADDDDVEEPHTVLLRLSPMTKLANPSTASVSFDAARETVAHSGRTYSFYPLARKTRWEIWTRTHRIQFDAQDSAIDVPTLSDPAQILAIQEHGLGFVPVAICRNRAPVDSFWVDGNGGPDLLANALDVYRMIQRYQWLCHLAHGQYVIALAEETRRPTYTAQDAPWYLRPGESAQTLQSGAQLSSILEGVEVALDLLAISAGLPTGSIRLAALGSTSGHVADMIEVIGSRSQSDRPQRRALFASAERRLHLIGASYISSLDPDVSISYSEPDTPLDPAERDARVRSQLDLGLITRAEALQSYEPGLSAESAAERVERALADRERFRRIDIAIARDPSVLADAPPGAPPGPADDAADSAEPPDDPAESPDAA